MRRIAVALLLTTLLVAGCSSGGGGSTAGSTRPVGTSSVSSSSTQSTTTTTSPPATGVFAVGSDGVQLLDAPGGSPAGRIRAGVLLPYDHLDGSFAHVVTPCDTDAWVPLGAGRAEGPFRVAIDPGHGGSESGAVGPTGLAEKTVNLDVATDVVSILNGRGIPSVLTRTGDYRATLAFRVQLAKDAGVGVFVSIHHNAEPDEHRSTPGTESYYQIRSDDSKRLTGLLQEEVYRAYSRYHVRFGADYDAGAKYRLSKEGQDYYGVLRHSFDDRVVAALVESAFITNPPEEALLRRSDVRHREAQAVARAIERYFAGDRPGDVFTTPYARTEPAGGGGGRQGCRNPS